MSIVYKHVNSYSFSITNNFDWTHQFVTNKIAIKNDGHILGVLDSTLINQKKRQFRQKRLHDATDGTDTINGKTLGLD
ncbi:hypothetical protein SAMN04487897_11664 [Paenibacillus sp. yr247]|nr:hypothetical protein SAMN04487897_11664 [Paenibacillus sp. yr247]